ncbi:carbohydrate ABC transporter substrate-binding protein [Nonomuraea sp. K274]|uniref:Carbohydrate ABC transporter substrate-binding protein n=1 Tax=Nonomuraea cypriaca TaxID=1187855 RepID=A0A931EXW2_9ACTN|nr:ABC transporter substrate-binding protein [Nonomuraea cypriaca]MBF8184611.1 carbohydrate ABC transporter substrate-binding protein [Nonomuraea cypriaca]
MMQKARGFALLALALTVTTGVPAAANASPQPSAACKDVPNQYDVPFSVCDDEVFIFAVNYKPFESTIEGEADNNQGPATRVFDEIIGNKLRAAFPDVKIKYATWDYPVRYEELKAAGVTPDVIIEDPKNRIDRDLEPMGWVGDLTPDLQKAGIDLSKLNPATVELVKSRSDGGIYGVPLFIDEHVLLYNKKIFDKFKVKYPKPGMTYDEAYKKAKQLTKDDGLDHYKGYMQHPDQYLDFNQAGLYAFQPTTSEEPAPEDVKVDISGDAWKKHVDNLYRFLTIPRNEFTTVTDFFKGDMSQPGHLAMAVDTLSRLNMYAGSELFIEDGDEESFAEQAKSVDIGVSAIPVLKTGSKTVYQPNTRAAFIPPSSPEKEQALQIVKWMVSEEGQTELSRHGVKAVLQTDQVVQNFGKAIPELADIDTSAVYWGENATISNYQNTEYWDLPLWSVYRQHILRDGGTPAQALTVSQQQDIPNYIKNQAAAGKDW